MPEEATIWWVSLLGSTRSFPNFLFAQKNRLVSENEVTDKYSGSPTETQGSESETPDLTSVPEEYHELAEVFRKSKNSVSPSSQTLWLCHV